MANCSFSFSATFDPASSSVNSVHTRSNVIIFGNNWTWVFDTMRYAIICVPFELIFPVFGFSLRFRLSSSFFFGKGSGRGRFVYWRLAFLGMGQIGVNVSLTQMGSTINALMGNGTGNGIWELETGYCLCWVMSFLFSFFLFVSPLSLSLIPPFVVS